MVQGGDSLIVRVDSDQAPSRRGSADHHHAVAQPPSVIMNSDMEAFGNRLSAIVNADFYAAALAVGPVDVPLGMHCLLSSPAPHPLPLAADPLLQSMLTPTTVTQQPSSW